MRNPTLKKCGLFSWRRTLAGYTLIETAIIMSVAGLVLASFAGVYGIYVKNKIQEKTVINTSLAINALGNYLIQSGRYPCPAPIDVPRTDARYGLEDCAAAAALAAGDCANGICAEESNRTVDNDPNPLTTAMVTPKVYRGAVPFRTLGMREQSAEDGRSMRLNYAVTDVLTNEGTFQKQNGGISIIDGTGKSILEPAHSAPYLVFSPGADRAGGYTRYGLLYSPCPTGTMDAENCNTSSTNDKAVYRYAETSTTGGTTHYDDFMKFAATVETPLWKISDASGTHIRDLIDADSVSGGQVGIGVDDPADGVVLDVEGPVVAQQDAHTQELCESDGADCFPVETISADDPKMDCTDPSHPGYDPSKPYIQSIGDAQVYCTDRADLKCKDGEVLAGMNADGSLNCVVARGCPARNFELCSDSSAERLYTVPAGVDRQRHASPTIGASYIQNFICEDSRWWKIAGSGSCTCAPMDETVAESCQELAGEEGFWSGSAVIHQTRQCPSGEESYEVTHNCVCEPRSWVETTTCPSGSGTMSYRYSWVCDGVLDGRWEPAELVEESCECTPRVETEVEPCGAADLDPTHGRTYNRNLSCDGGDAGMGWWTEWALTSNTCTCAPRSETRTIACPLASGDTDPSHSISQQRDLTCSSATSGSWSAWRNVTNTCTCTSTTQNRTVGCPSGQTGSVNQTRTYNCETFAWRPWTEVSRSCVAACVGTMAETRETECPLGMSGQILERRTYDCSTTVWSEWSEVSRTCAAVAYTWKKKGEGSGPFGAQLPIRAGTTCAIPGETKDCSAAISATQFWHYDCMCE